MKITTLYISRDDEYDNTNVFEFTVPTDWLEKKIEDYEMTLEEFMEEYTSDESNELYGAALLDGVTEEIKGYCEDEENDEEDMD